MASMIHSFPDVLTHRFHPLRGAFQNICHLSPGSAEEIISKIRAETGSYRKPDYLVRRMQVEAWLMAERSRKLGKTFLSRPIYFFLGRLADELDQTRPASVVVPLAAFDPAVLTFTFSDSMSEYAIANTIDHAAGFHRGQVYTLPEIRSVVHRFGFPDPELPREVRGQDSFIEVQAWDDRPLAGYGRKHLTLHV